MNADELIDNVAGQITALETRPALRTRVLVRIDDAVQQVPRRWLMPVAAVASVVAVALAWFLVPSQPVIEDAPAVARQAPVVVTEPEVAQPAAIHMASVTAEPSRRAAVAVPAPVMWETTPLAEIPGLPPLAGPPPIVIEPITWDDVTITPLRVELIEVKALVIEPLAGPDRSGV